MKIWSFILNLVGIMVSLVTLLACMERFDSIDEEFKRLDNEMHNRFVRTDDYIFERYSKLREAIDK